MNGLAKMLFNKRSAKFLTQEQMAKEIGISRMSYYKLETGKATTISLYTIRKLSKYFKNTETYIMHKYLEK